MTQQTVAVKQLALFVRRECGSRAGCQDHVIRGQISLLTIWIGKPKTIRLNELSVAVAQANFRGFQLFMQVFCGPRRRLPAGA
jgi:hypothetical protein